MAIKEFKKSHKLKISRLKGGYSASVMFVLSLCLKDLDMCVREKKTLLGINQASEEFIWIWQNL